MSNTKINQKELDSINIFDNTSEELENIDVACSDGADIFTVHDDAFKMYLREISVFDVLSKEEEIELFKQLENGDPSVKQIIVNHNLKLVINMSKHYMGLGLNALDLVQAGNMGLITAVDKFDYKLGYKFSTYASHWIKQSMTRAISNHGRLIRIPVHIFEQYYRCMTARRILINNFQDNHINREPTDEEIVKYVNKHKMLVNPDTKLTLDRFIYIRNLVNNKPTYLETPVDSDSDDGATLGDFVIDPNSYIENYILTEDLETSLNTAINEYLKEKEQNIIRMRFGLAPYESPHTLDAVGKAYGVTRERVRQIQEKCLRKLKAHQRLFIDYLD